MSCSVRPTPPSAMASVGRLLSGKAGSTPTLRKRPASLPGPTAASTFTAGMLSDCASASRMVTVPWKSSSKFFGRVAAEADGAILDQRLGVREAGLEGETVDEGLQRRARRAHGVDHVDGAEACVVEVAGRADVGDDFAGRVIDGEDGGRKLLTEQLGLLLGETFERLLHSAVDGQPVNGLFWFGHHLGFGEVRGELGKGAAPDRHRLVSGAAGFRRGDHAFLGRSLQHAVTREARRARVAIRAAPFGRLRQRDEQRRLADRQTSRLFAEVGERSGAHALDVAAERGEAQVQRRGSAASSDDARAAARRRSGAPSHCWSARSGPR